MKSVFIDTNAILRFLLNDIPQQKNIVENLLKQAKKGEIKLTVIQIVIFELDFILRKYYHFSKEEVIEKLESIVGTDYLNVESKEVFIPALELYSNSVVSLVDCFLVCKAKNKNAQIFTFDKDLKKLADNL